MKRTKPGLRDIVFVLMLLPLAAPAQDKKDADRNVTLTFQPALLFIPVGAAMAEVRVADPVSVAVFGGYGSFTYTRDNEQVDASITGIGGQVRWYPLKRSTSEPHLGLQALWAHGSGDEEDHGYAGFLGDDIWGRGYDLVAGPFGGYKYTAPFGLTVEAQLGLQVGVEVSDGGEGNTGTEDSGMKFKLLPVANLNLGWSF